MYGKMTLRKKIALLLTASVLIVAFAAWGFIYKIEREKLIENNRETLSRYLDAFKKSGEENGVEGIKDTFKLWVKVYPEGRLTVINTLGEVIFDSMSDPLVMDNHYKRPEILKAFAAGDGSELRYSKTQGEWQSYMAKRVILPGNSGGTVVIRLSYPLDKLKGLAWSMGKPFLYSLEIVLLLVWIGAYWMLGFMMKPLNSLSRAAEKIAAGGTARFPITGDVEIQSLSNALNSMSDSLKLSANEAQERKEELALLIGALPVGVILIDEAKKLRYMNETASILCGRSGIIPSRGTSAEVILPSEEMCRTLDDNDGTKLVILPRRGGLKLEVTTRTLTRGRLIVIQDLTEKMRLEEARREFFIDAGHEFQTPLTVIRMGLEMLKSGNAISDKEDIEAVNSMIRQQERISGLVDDLLFLVRLDVDSLNTGFEDIEITGMTKELISEIKLLPMSCGITIEGVFPETEALVKGRYNDIRRAILNLLENGVKYVAASGETNGKINIGISERKDMWEISVDDNGPGVPETERNLIFECFRRGDTHRARNGVTTGGYGLGLSISRRIAERHGGSLQLADSKIGGASFVMKLPKVSH